MPNVTVKKMGHHLRHAVAVAVMAIVLTACGQEEGGDETARDARQPAAEAAIVSSWAAFVDQYIEDYFKAHPTFAVTQGRHEYDGILPDWSEAGLSREIERLHGMRRRAGDFAGPDLDDAERFERDYVIASIDRQLYWLERADWPHRNPAFYFDWLMDSLDPNVYIARPYAPADVRLKAFIKYANAVPAAAGQIRANLKAPLPRTYIHYGAAAFGGLADYYETDVKTAFASVADEALQAELAAAAEVASLAMRSLADWLEGQRAEATEDFALGPELFRDMVRMTERVDLTLDELAAIGRADLDRNLAALTEACAAYAPEATVHACVDRVQDDKPEGGAVAGARAQLGGLKAFLIEKKLVSIPGEEVALVAEAPPYNRQNFAYIDIPGTYETGMPSTYYIAPPDPAWTEAVQHAYLPGRADLLFTSVHEVWPGHFLNFLHANRAPSKFGKVFVGYAYAEGWAHYTEEMMWEAGYGAGDHATHIGQLLNATLRNVRFLSAIGLHARGMTVAESERMFVEEGYQGPGTARQQAARGTYDPGYLNYTMGKLMIRRLRRDWTASRGGRDAWSAFHDAYLSYGGPPIPLVRGAMMGEEPEAKF